ncbi:hypothetical protein BOG82_002165, partial [Neisseria gonorrhoeae]
KRVRFEGRQCRLKAKHRSDGIVGSVFPDGHVQAVCLHTGARLTNKV